MSVHRYYSALDGLRGLAALVVVERHAPNFFGGIELPSSHLAVDLFFCLSGFVIATAYDTRLNSGQMDRAQFISARLLRFYPLYLLALSLAAGNQLIKAISLHHPLATIPFVTTVLCSIFFVPTPWNLSIGNGPFPLISAAWSLSCELVVNVLYALIVFRLERKLLVAVIAVGLLLLGATAAASGSLSDGSLWGDFIGGYGRVFFSFFAGILVYRYRPSASWLGVSGWPGMLVLAATFAVPASAELRPYYDLAVVVVVYPALIWATSAAKPGAASFRIFSVLGAASYAIYVLHQWVLQTLGFAFHVPLYPAQPEFSLRSAALGAVIMALLVATGWALDAWFDRPLRSALANLIPLGRRRVREA